MGALPSPVPAHRPRVVVGVDGSPESASALAWATEEAACRGASLEVVHAWTVPYAYAPMGVGAITIDSAAMQRESRVLLDEMVDAALAAAVAEPPEVHRVLVEGPAASTLLRLAENADLLVVGTRGRGAVTGLVLGSVSRQCTHHASCPVVVVPLSDRT